VNPAPVIEAELTVTGDVPDDVRANDCDDDEFTATLPKLRVVTLKVNCGLPVVPIPLKDTTAVPPVIELLLMVSFPAADPLAAGLN
jgi:hypothetical protein